MGNPKKDFQKGRSIGHSHEHSPPPALGRTYDPSLLATADGWNGIMMTWISQVHILIPFLFSLPPSLLLSSLNLPSLPLLFPKYSSLSLSLPPPPFVWNCKMERRYQRAVRGHSMCFLRTPTTLPAGTRMVITRRKSEALTSSPKK